MEDAISGSVHEKKTNFDIFDIRDILELQMQDKVQ